MMQLQEAVRIYTVCSRAEGKSERTIEWVASAVRYLCNFIGNTAADISQVDADCLRRFILFLKGSPTFRNHPYNPTKTKLLSPESVSSYVRAIKSLFALLVREGYLDANPIEKVKTPKVPIKEMPVLSEAEIKRIVAQIDRKSATGNRNYVMILLLLDTGIRVSELCGLDIRDVDFNSGYIRILGKGNKERLVPMGYKLTKLLRKYLHDHHPEGGSDAMPFFMTVNGERMLRNRVAKVIRDYAIKAGISDKRVSPHVFRSTKAVFYLRNGGDVFSLQKCLGHADLTMTRRYCVIADSDVKNAHLKFSPLDRLKI